MNSIDNALKLAHSLGCEKYQNIFHSIWKRNRLVRIMDSDMSPKEKINMIKPEIFETIEERMERESREKEVLSRAWHEMLSSESAFLCFKSILVDFGYGKPMASLEDMQIRNFLDYLLDRIAEGNMDVYTRLLTELKQLP